MDDALMIRLAEIEERTQRLEDKEQARNLLHTYAAVLDDPEPDAIAALFEADATLRTTTGVHRGRPAIAEFFRAARSADDSEKRHFVTSPDVEWISPGCVKISSYFIYTARSNRDAVLGWGTYEDLVSVSAVGAKFTSKFIDVQFRGEIGTGWQLPAEQVQR